MMRIAVRVPNWIGDSVLAIPAVKSLKTNFPDSSISIIAKTWVKDIFMNLDFVDEIVTIPDQNNLTDIRSAAKKLKKYDFNAGLLLTNSFLSALLFAMAGIPKRWGYKRDGRQLLLTESIPDKNPRTQIHQVLYYQNILSGLGFKTYPPKLQLAVTEQEKALAGDFLRSCGFEPKKKTIILNPGAYFGSAKRWPASQYASLAKMLQKKAPLNLLIIGSKAERELALAITASLKKKPVDLAGKTSLRMLTAIMSLADVVVSNDSGPMHMSNALGIPVIALFGPTVPAATQPFQQPYTLIKKDVPCWPCSYRACPYEHQCMLKITPEEVFSECERFLS